MDRQTLVLVKLLSQLKMFIYFIVFKCLLSGDFFPLAWPKIYFFFIFQYNEMFIWILLNKLQLIFNRESDSKIAYVHLSVIKTPQPLRIKPICLSKLCLLIIMTIDHKAYELYDLLLRLLSLLACWVLNGIFSRFITLWGELFGMRELHKSEMKIIRCGAPEDIAQILNYTIPDVQLKSTVFQL